MTPDTTPKPAPGTLAADLFWQALQPDSSPNSVVPGPRPTTPSMPRHELAILTRLAHAAQTIQRLKDTSWWLHPEPTWQDTLNPLSFGAVYARIVRAGSTGVLHVHNRHGEERIVGFTAGTPMAAASRQKRDALGTFLLERGILNAADAERARVLAASTGKPVGWALLSLQLIDPDRLLRAQQDQVQDLITQLMGWAEGVADFYEESAVVDLRRILDVQSETLLRDAFAHIYLHDAATLRSFTMPLFNRAEPLRYEPLPDPIAAVADVDAALLDCARNSQSPDLLLRAVSMREPAALARLLADVYVLNQLGALSFKSEPRYVRLANIPQKFHQKAVTPARSAAAAPLAAYQAQKDMLVKAKKSLYAFAPGDALAGLQAFAGAEHSPTSEVVAYYSLALLLTGDKKRAAEQAARAMKMNNQDAMAHAAMARVFDANADSNGAFHRKQALGLSQNNRVWYNEVSAALNITAAPVAAVGPADGRAVYLWTMVAITGLALFAAANILRMGTQEYFYLPDDVFFFARRGVLLVVGLAGMCAWQHASPLALLRAMPWRISSNMMIGVVIWGVIVGAMSPVQRVRGSLDVVMYMTLFHVLAEEVFFRGFVTRMLLDQISEKRFAVVCSGILYGVYHITYQSFWLESGLEPRSFYVGSIALMAGIPYAAFFRESRSLLAPFVCHLLVSSLMMLHSAWARGFF